MLSGLLLAMPKRLLPPSPKLLESSIILLGLAFGFFLAGNLESGDPLKGRIGGIWRDSFIVEDGLFSGRLAGRGELLVRGTGRQLPSPGSIFSADGLFLQSSRFASPEFRISRWTSSSSESVLERNSRKGSVMGRSRVLFPLTRQYSGDRRSLARALLFGDKRALKGSIRRSFRDAGLAHLLALSGLHVGLFLLLLRRLITPLTGRPSRAEWMLLILLPFLPAWGGGGASIHRAAFMAGYILLVRRLGGRPLGMEALAFAACAELILHPASLFEPGFQLSYLATAALLGFTGRKIPLVVPRFKRLMHTLVEGIAVSTLCTLATLPVILTCFDRLPLAGPIWNLVAAPLTAASLFSGWICLPLGKIQGALALPDFFFSMLLALADLAGSRWRMLLSDFAVPSWTWLAWGLGIRGILGPRRWFSWILASTPLLAGWLLGGHGWNFGPSVF
jgi:ComEC/Rec2-related protein